jgi:hypothetical protein
MTPLIQGYYVFMHACMYVCMCAGMCACIYGDTVTQEQPAFVPAADDAFDTSLLCVYACMYVYVCMCAGMYACVCVYGSGIR